MFVQCEGSSDPFHCVELSGSDPVPPLGPLVPKHHGRGPPNLFPSLPLFSPNPNLLLAIKRQPPAISALTTPCHLSLSCIYGLSWVFPLLSILDGSCQQRSNAPTSPTRQDDRRSLRCLDGCCTVTETCLHGDTPLENPTEMGFGEGHLTRWRERPRFEQYSNLDSQD